jgi:UDP-N-acetylmuramoyl-tripeptide--D-alanyl-D-alanine ligase
MERIELPDGVVLIDDTYNANPQSMAAALRSVVAWKGAGRALAVLGDMGELGDAAVEAHRGVGRLAAEPGLDLLVAVGRHAGTTLEGARAGGLAGERALACAEHGEAAEALRPMLRPGDWVLVKGSRSARMERIVEALGAEAKETH